MGIDTTEQQEREVPARPAKESSENGVQPEPQRRRGIGESLAQLRTGMSELRWGPVLIFGVIAGMLMSLSLMQGSMLSIIAGIVPVGTGLLIARRVKAHYGLHGFMAGLIGGIISLLGTVAIAFLIPLDSVPPEFQAGVDRAALAQALFATGGFLAFALVTFSTFGAMMAGRSEERNRALVEEVQKRGGRLERVSAVRTPDDIRGLSLPQLGWYVNNLFKKKGFTFKDYQFLDKDKHLDLWLEYEGEPWHLRLSVADKINPGTIEGLSQEMKREGCRKGVVIASTEFTPSALKTAKGRPIVLIDGPTLYQIAEG